MPIISLGSDNFQKEVFEEKKLPVVVDFSASWCGPCQALAPILEEVAVEYKDKIKIAKVDVDKSPEIANQFSVMSVPTLIFFKDGEKIDEITGLVTKEELKKRLDKLT